MTVFAHRTDADRMVRRLMRCRCVDVERQADAEINDKCFSRYTCEAEAAEQEKRVEQISAALAELHRHCDKSPLVKSRQTVDPVKFRQDGRYTEAWQIVTRTEEILAELTRLKGEQNRSEMTLMQLRPWRDYDLPLSLTATERTNIVLGSFPLSTDPEYLCDSLARDGACCEMVSADSRMRYAVLIYHRDDADKLGGRLAELGFLRAPIKAEGALPRAELTAAARALQWLREEQKVLRDELMALAQKTPMVEILSDIERTTLTAIRTRADLLCTANCVMLVGWVPDGALPRVTEMLDSFSCAYALSEPEEGDDVPILLQNNRFAANFEWVLGMYSYPRYGGFDPTFVMSIFYFLIFGIMFADVGYGLLLVLGCFGGIALFKPGQGMRRFLAMFGLCGVSSIVWGVVFGAYFGDLPRVFAANMLGIAFPERVALWFDPLQDPMAFLVFSLAVGAVHLIAGMAVQFYLLCRAGKPLDALMDIGSWWVLFAGLGLLFVWPKLGVWIAIGGVLCIVLTQGRAKKGIVGKLFGGMGKLYDIISYISDLLSYSRILALGLAAGVIAQVVNILGTLKGGTFLGYLLFVLVFLIGHLLNLAINVLGTFVHTSRLQYIEFFNKFYEDGGRPFRPALPVEEYSAADESK